MQSFTDQPYSDLSVLSVAEAPSQDRAAFIRRTYTHLAGAIGAFIIIEALLLQTALPDAMLRFIQSSQYAWLLILGGFIVTGWLARGLAANVQSIAMQYTGLGLYVVIEALIFVPILSLAVLYSDPKVIPMAGIITAALFGGLTLVAFMTRADFSFLRGILAVGGMVALGMIVCAAVFGFTLGLVFSVGMVALAGGAILYDTSKIIHHYNTNQHVAASLELFASVALMFWYVLRILMRTNR